MTVAGPVYSPRQRAVWPDVDNDGEGLEYPTIYLIQSAKVRGTGALGPYHHRQYRRGDSILENSPQIVNA